MTGWVTPSSKHFILRFRLCIIINITYLSSVFSCLITSASFFLPSSCFPFSLSLAESLSFSDSFSFCFSRSLSFSFSRSRSRSLSFSLLSRSLSSSSRLDLTSLASSWDAFDAGWVERSSESCFSSVGSSLASSVLDWDCRRALPLRRRV